MEELVSVSRRLAKRVDRLRFAAPVAYVYNPLTYARAPHEAYLALLRTADRARRHVTQLLEERDRARDAEIQERARCKAMSWGRPNAYRELTGANL